METLKIIGLCTIGAILFGIAHDMVTAHVCVEYFSIGHYNIFGDRTGPPFVYALYWGVVATWWVGLPSGVLLGLAARVSRLPKLTCRQVAPMLAVALTVLWLAAMLLLVVNLPLGRSGIAGFFSPMPSLGEAELRFLTARAVHTFSYLAAIAGVLVLAAAMLWKRTRLRRALTAADSTQNSQAKQ